MTRSRTDFCSALNLLHWLNNGILEIFQIRQLTGYLSCDDAVENVCYLYIVSSRCRCQFKTFVWIDCCHVAKCNATFQLRPNLNSSSSSLQSVLGNRSQISFKKWFLSKPQKLSSVLSKEQFVRYWQNMSLNIQKNLLTLSAECEESFVARYFSRHLRNTIHRCLWR